MPKKHKKVCALCGKDYETYSSIFCSWKCYNKFRETDKDYKENKRLKFIQVRADYLKKNNRPMGFQSGELNPAKTPTLRQKMSQFRKGVPLSKAQRRKQSISLKKTLKNPEILKKWRDCKLGKKQSEETKAKIALSHSLRPKKFTTLKQNLDTIFSKYIRRLNSQNEQNVCFTCGKTISVKEIQCGHFMSRNRMTTRWDEVNCQPQCIHCNIFDQGCQYIFGVNLDKKYGQGTAEKLRQKSLMLAKYTPEKLSWMIDHYKKELKKLRG